MIKLAVILNFSISWLLIQSKESSVY